MTTQIIHINKMMNAQIAKLNNALNQKNKQEVEKALEEIVIHKIPETVPFLISILNTTTDHFLRNRLALALADIGDQRAVKPLITLAKLKSLTGHKGTLIYALQSLNCESIFLDLVDLAIHDDGWEARTEAIGAIETIKVIDFEELELAYKKADTTLYNLNRQSPITEGIQDKVASIHALKYELSCFEYFD